MVITRDQANRAGANAAEQPIRPGAAGGAPPPQPNPVLPPNRVIPGANEGARENAERDLAAR